MVMYFTALPESRYEAVIFRTKQGKTVFLIKWVASYAPSVSQNQEGGRPLPVVGSSISLPTVVGNGFTPVKPTVKRELPWYLQTISSHRLMSLSSRKVAHPVPDNVKVFLFLLSALWEIDMSHTRRVFSRRTCTSSPIPITSRFSHIADPKVFRTRIVSDSH